MTVTAATMHHLHVADKLLKMTRTIQAQLTFIDVDFFAVYVAQMLQMTTRILREIRPITAAVIPIDFALRLIVVAKGRTMRRRRQHAVLAVADVMLLGERRC